MVQPLTREQKVRNNLFNKGCDDGYEGRPINEELRSNDPYFRGYICGVDLRERDVADDDPYGHNLDIELEVGDDESP